VAVASVKVPPIELLVVTDRELRTHARNLVRAASAHRPIEWCFDTEFEARAKTGSTTRALFLGETKFGTFISPLIKQKHHKHGVVWGIYKQQAVLQTENVIIDARATIPKIRASITRMKTEAQFQIEASTYNNKVDEGPLIAHAFLEASEGHASLRLDRAATAEADVQRACADNQYVFGIAWFLMEGGWADLIGGTSR
jgi:hypothetical protein